MSKITGVDRGGQAQAGPRHFEGHTVLIMNIFQSSFLHGMVKSNDARTRHSFATKIQYHAQQNIEFDGSFAGIHQSNVSVLIHQNHLQVTECSITQI